VVGILIEMKLAALRRSLATTRVTWIATGAIAGVAAAAGLLLLATADGNEPTTVGSLLAVAFALYGLGWVLGPVSGGEPVLRPAQFRLLPIPPRTLAAGLLAAGAVGVGAAVTLLAFVSLVVYGARLGAVPALLAALAVVPQLAGLLVLARIAGAVFGRLATSRLGGAAVGVATAGLLLATQSGWVVIERAGRVLDAGMPAVLEGVVRALPSGWGVVAVEAAHRADWPLAIGALGGLLTLGALLFVVWARMVADPEAGGGGGGGGGGGAGRGGGRRASEAPPPRGIASPAPARPAPSWPRSCGPGLAIRSGSASSWSVRCSRSSRR
jgi:hypothetical protein